MLAIGLPCGVVADPLSDIDAQLLLERLKQLRDGEKERSDSRLIAAYKSFSAAVQSDSAAHELYVKCVEKVRFEDDNKSGSDFRDWRRRHKEREDSPGFRRALRHQLGWLLLTLQVAMKPEERNELAKTAIERLDMIFRDRELLHTHQGMLRGNALGSVYAVAYGVGGVEVEDWPGGPLQLQTIYEKLIFPPLRRPDRVDTLRSAWMRRIAHEGAMADDGWGRRSNGRNRDDEDGGMQRFVTERRPELIWMMESDLFAAGDQKNAALRMLKHIERYLGHENESKWIEEFESMVLGKDKPPEDKTEGSEADDKERR